MRIIMLPIASLITAFLVAGASAASETGKPELIRERIEWCDIWFTDAEKDALPRVLLIGDSITRGYFDGVEKALEGKAYCGRLTTSRSVCDPVFFDELALVLKQYEFAAIHFNNGLHGWGYDEEQYRQGFSKLLDTLQSQAPGAKLICGTTTPVQGKAKDYHADRVPARNTIARELCLERKIGMDDLHALVNGKAEWFSDDGVHFNDEGRAAEARQAAASIQPIINK